MTFQYMTLRVTLSSADYKATDLDGTPCVSGQGWM
jgi:hypothetical protein